VRHCAASERNTKRQPLFAALGEILFEVVGSPESLDSSRAYNFAEHRVIESKPRLQWVGNDLERLHSSVANRAIQLSQLKIVAGAHRALPLVFGNGGFRGFFVIETIALRSQQLSADGSPIAITAALALKEWAIETELAASAASRPLLLPLGIVGGGAGLSGPDGFIPGVSALLSLAAASGATGPNLEATDVAISSIVRSVIE
jgi:phage protein U